MSGQVVEKNGGEKDRIELQNPKPGKLAHPNAMQKKGEGEQKHEIFPGWQTKQVTNDFEEWIHRSHPLVIKQSGFLFLGSHRGHPARSQEHQEKALENE